MKTITHQEIIKFVNEQVIKALRGEKVEPDIEPMYESMTHELEEAEVVNVISTAFDQMADKVILAFNHVGLEWNKEFTEIVIRDDETLSKCSEIINTISEAYDGDDQGQVWEEYGLGGDDDVDYNASMPSVLIDVLKLMKA